MVKSMSPGSVIVDLASERGGNCELTQPGEKIVAHGVTIIGWYNLASTVPYHASQMYARNVSAFLLHMIKDGKLRSDLAQEAATDEIIRDTLLTNGGEIVNHRLREFYKLPPLVTASQEKK
jgi:NAD(P) transhydrogenase subunit alpha